MAKPKQTFVAVMMIFVWGLGVPSALTLLSTPSTAQENTSQQWNRKAIEMIPVLKPGASAQEKADAVTELEIGMRRMKNEIQGDPSVPKEVHEGIRIWESLSPADRMQLLSGSQPKPRTALIFTPLAAVTIAAAVFIYNIGKDYSWWGKKAPALEFRKPTEKELDYLKKQQSAPGEGGSKPTSERLANQFDERVLNF